MQRPVVPVPPDARQLQHALTGALDGSGPAVLPVDSRADRSGDRPPVVRQVPEPVALVVQTSGSEGTRRAVLLDAAALRASAEGTAARLGGPGSWLLLLPLTHVAGLQVLVRSVLAGTTPQVLTGPFDPRAAADAIGRLPGRRYTSLVPTQLRRILAAGDLTAWAELDAILVGGGPIPPSDLAAARAGGLKVVVSYGLTETAGGCVYGGLPLPGVDVRVGDTIEISGPVLARGYRPAALDRERFVTDDGRRWLRTGDLGELREGRLQVLGRRDEVLITGGVNVAPAAVEAVLRELPGVHDACVVGLADPEWGQAVTAVVVPDGAGPDLTGLRAAVGRRLGRAAAPRHLVLTDRLPVLGPGKVDRAAATRLAATALAGRH